MDMTLSRVQVFDPPSGALVTDFLHPTVFLSLAQMSHVHDAAARTVLADTVRHAYSSKRAERLSTNRIRKAACSTSPLTGRPLLLQEITNLSCWTDYGSGTNIA
jgi:hypothetical protein